MNKPLAAVSAIVDQGNEVVFGKESYIRNIESGIKIPMIRRNGTYEIVVEFEVDDEDEDEDDMEIGVVQEAALFMRPARPLAKFA